MKYLNKLLTKIDTKAISFSGLSQLEIDKISALSTMPLPISYLEFLETMGKDMSRKDQSHHGFLVGIDVFYRYIPQLKEGAFELLQEDNSKLNLKSNDFVFYSAQGCDFAFFKLDEGDNPPIYYYREGSNQNTFKKIAESFSSFLERFYDQDRSLFQ
jgi:hypothetical protein